MKGKCPCDCENCPKRGKTMGSYQYGSFGGAGGGAGAAYPTFGHGNLKVGTGGGGSNVSAGGAQCVPGTRNYGNGICVTPAEHASGKLNPNYRNNQGGGGGGGSTGFSGGGGGGGGATMPYQPGAPKVQNLIDPLAQAGKGLLDPNSAYSQRMRTELSEDIGGQAEAQQRAAALRAARSGLGAGASPELLETQGQIGQQGLEAYGDASARALLGGMQLGGQLLNPALQGQLGLQGQQLQGFLSQQESNAQKDLAQQQLAQQQAQMQFQAQMAQQQMANDMMLRQLSVYSGL